MRKLIVVGNYSIKKALLGRKLFHIESLNNTISQIRTKYDKIRKS